MMYNAFIYRIINPVGSVYIGSTSNPKQRFNYYERLKCKSQIKLYRSLLKYGFNNHSISIIDNCPKELVRQVERVYGIAFDVLNRDNLNLKIPGKDDRYPSYSQETKNKMSEWQIGRKMSDESRNKMSISKSGVPKSDETKKKLSEANKGKGGRISFLGKKHSDETKLKMSAWQKGKPKIKKYKP